MKLEFIVVPIDKDGNKLPYNKDDGFVFDDVAFVTQKQQGDTISIEVGIIDEETPQTNEMAVEELLGPENLPPIGPAKKEEKTTPFITPSSDTIPSKPSKEGIIVVGERAAGQKFDIGEDISLQLRDMRKDFGIVVLSRERSLQLKLLEKNIFVKSKTFNAINDIEIKLAIQNLVIEEQKHTRTAHKENFILQENKPQFVIDSLDDEKSGKGSFHYEEFISIYESPTELRTPQKEA